MSNKEQIEPNSLYIATEESRSHWSLFITDAYGGGTKYHWNIRYWRHYKLGSALPTDTPLQASYEREHIPNIEIYITYEPYLTFTKIGRWNLKPEIPPCDLLGDCLSSIFDSYMEKLVRHMPDSYRDFLSREWVMRAVASFERNGWLGVLNKQVLMAIEDVVSLRSHLASSKFSNEEHGTIVYPPYIGPVMGMTLDQVVKSLFM